MKNKSLLMTISILIFTLSSAAQIDGTYTDTRDGKVYKTVTIGTQTWMAENLAYKAGSGCYAYENDQNNVKTYGYIYKWKTSQKVCPSGWHLPGDEEWKTLELYIDMSKNEADTTGWRGTNQGDMLKEKGTQHWSNGNKGTDSYGFCALPGGSGGYKGFFGQIGLNGYWWSSSLFDKSNAWARCLFYDNSKIAREYYEVDKDGLSVRCIKD